ncbi:uncharacterized protein DUF4345 [Kribbella antiqua]|uniref:Uncharacterized protein DUF4345 n=1 Tax=Kribbella antiqua TaxID=2512217 RepID=A0A4R2IIV5_9ACTN|nr:DUF4345 domain-containing protein [Kribbella antiqua]TCO44961.1 uncharacterized protein DUF4345 [Kribbella antiqua]
MIAILVVAAFFAGMGVLGLASPAALVRPFGIQVAGPHARTEVRAVYGGFGIAVAGLLVVAAFDDGIRRGAVIAVAVALAGMATGRLIGRIFDRPATFYPIWFYFWVELVLAAVLWFAA